MDVEVPDHEIVEDVSVDPGRTALVIVDMQNDFVREDGCLAVPDAAATIPAIRLLRDLAHKHGMPVYYTQDSHYADDPEFAVWGEHVVVGTPGWEIVDELRPVADAGDRVFRKDRYDGFFRTTLEPTLADTEVDTLIICGTVANVCVLYTAASAAMRWFSVILPVDAVSALSEFDLQATIRQIAFVHRGIITRSGAIGVRREARD